LVQYIENNDNNDTIYTSPYIIMLIGVCFVLLFSRLENSCTFHKP